MIRSGTAWGMRLAGAVAVLASLVGFIGPANGQDVLPVPALTARVIDQTGTLGAQADELDAKLAAFEAASGPQIVVLMVPTTQPEDIASYAYRVADTWKIGRREVGDGVLVIVAKDDRKVRIEVAKALEGAIPDLAARQVIDRAITPAFRAGDYAGGLSQAVDLLEARIRGEDLPAPARKKGRGGAAANASSWGHLALMFFFGVFIGGAVLRAFLGRTLGTLATGAGAGLLTWLAGAGLVVAGIAGVVALVVAGVSGLGSAIGGLAGGGLGRRRGNGLFWGGVGMGMGGFGGGGRGGFGGGGGGGFSSGGGGDFGGGGASGGW